MALPPADRNRNSQTTSRAAFLAVWLVPQICALAISAFRIPLWARFPEAGETLALPLMLAVQIATAAILLPSFEDWRKSATALLAAWPMAIIAGSMSAAPLGATIRGEIDVAVWIISIAFAAMVCQLPTVRGIAWAIANTWSLGGGLLAYLRLEFLSNASPLPVFLAGPMVNAIWISLGESRLPFVFPLITTAIMTAISTALQRRQSKI